jgi:hypothetical protein
MATPVGAVFSEIRDIDSGCSDPWTTFASAKEFTVTGVSILGHRINLELRSTFSQFIAGAVKNIADLQRILYENFLRVAPMAIKHIRVLKTIKEGLRVYPQL